MRGPECPRSAPSQSPPAIVSSPSSTSSAQPRERRTHLQDSAGSASQEKAGERRGEGAGGGPSVEWWRCERVMRERTSCGLCARLLCVRLLTRDRAQACR